MRNQSGPKKVGVSKKTGKRRPSGKLPGQSGLHARAFFESARDAIFVADAETGVIVDVNAEAERLTGRSKAQLVGMHQAQLHPPAKAAHYRDLFKRQVETGGKGWGEATVLTADGREIPVEVSASLLEMEGKRRLLQSNCRDVSDRKRTEQALQASEAMLKSIFKSAPVGIGVVGNRVLRWTNDRLHTMTGYSPEELEGKSSRILYPSDEDYEYVGWVKYEQIRQHGAGTVETRWKRKDGRIIDILLSSTPIKPDDLSAGVTFTALDITGRKQAEAALLIKNRSFDAAISANSIADPQGRLIEVNASFLSVWGYSAREEILGRPIPDFFQDEATARSILSKLDAEDICQTEFAAKRKDGSAFIAHGMATTLRDREGKRVGYQSAVVDITERKRAEEALERERNLLRTLIDHIPDSIYVRDTANRFVLANEAVAHRMGAASPADLLGKTDADFFSAEQAGRFAGPDREVLAGRALINFEEDIVCLDGKHRIILSTKVPLKDAQGAVTALVGIGREITEHKQAEEALRKSEERLRLALEAANQGLYDLNVRTGDTHVSPEYATMLGYDPVKFHETNAAWLARLHPDDQARVAATYGDYLAGKLADYRVEFRQRTKSGDWKWILSLGRIVERDAEGKPLRMLGTHTDITERKRVEEKLRESEIKYRALIENVPGAVYQCEVHAPWRISHISQGAERVTGRTATDFIEGRLTWADIVVADDLPLVETAVERSVAGRQPYAMEYRIVHADGRIRWVHEIGQGFYDPEGRPACLEGVIFDITERKCADEALRESEYFLTRSQTVARLGSYKFEIATGAWTCSPALDEVFGIDDSFLRTTEGWLQLVVPGQREEMRRYLLQHVATERNRFEREYRIIRHNDGQERWVFGIGELEFDAQDQPVRMIGTIQDITERKQAEEEHQKLQAQLLQSQKMESVGRLAGGVAHDFNNMLTAIMAYSDLTLNRLPPADPLRSNMREIKTASEHAATLTRQLLAFSRKQVLQPQVLDLNDVVALIEKMLRRLIGEDIELEVCLTTPIRVVKADPGQLDQVIMNLAVNARDAMPDGGKLRVETSHAELDEAYCHLYPDVKPGFYVTLSVTDTGCGMPPEVLAHIFEPFFTTKEQGKGTGLGLATVYGIVKQSGGHISVDSEVGQGTTFRIYLPALAEGSRPDEAARIAPASLTGVETVLLVEDDERVRTMTGLSLREGGYTVLEAGSGPEALLKYGSHAQPIHVLITDMIMPGMTGIVLARQMQPRRPGMKVLFISGYAADATLQNGGLGKGAAFLQKPFSRDELLRKLREVLDVKPPDLKPPQ